MIPSIVNYPKSFIVKGIDLAKALCIFILLLSAASAYGQFQGTIDQMVDYNEKFPREMVYVQLDRELYNPGDTLWFKAYLREKVSLLDMTTSSTMNVRILGSSGKTIYDTRHLVHGSESDGQIALDFDLDDGMYELVCYSSWMKNYDIAEIFRKKFQIKNEKVRTPKFSCSFNEGWFYEGDMLLASVRFLDEDNKMLNGKMLNYTCYMGETILQKGSINTDSRDAIMQIIPRELSDELILKVSGTHRAMYYDTIIRLPVHRNINVGFFPEGGNMVQDLSNQIAFKAASERGVPIEIVGNICDEKGDKLFEIRSEHNGMGLFSLLPQKEEKYYLELTVPEGRAEKFWLPDPIEIGWLMHGEQIGGELQLTIVNNLKDRTPVLLTVSVRGTLLSYHTDTVGRFHTLSIPTEEMPIGVAVVTLFTENLLPQAERLVFINKERTKSVAMATAYSQYLPRDSVELSIQIEEDISSYPEGSYSLSIIDEELCMSPSLEEGNIITSFILSPEVSGDIYHPLYYFDPSSEQASEHLDLLLLTQGWRRYRYEEIFSESSKAQQTPSVKDIISGQLYSARWGRKREPIEGKITLYNAGSTFKFNTDKEGRFEYYHYYHPDLSPNLALLGEDMDGKTTVEIILDEDKFKKELELSPIQDPLSPRSVVYPELKADVEFQDNYTLGLNMHWLEEVIVYSNRNSEPDRVEESLSSVLSPNREVINSSTDVYDILLGMGLPVDIDYSSLEPTISYLGYPPGGVAWYLDDFPKPYRDVELIRPEDIEKLYVVKFPDTQFYIDMFDGIVVSVFTKPFVASREQKSSRNLVELKKFELKKEFYKPVYNTEALRYSQVPDLRKTIHWVPDLQIKSDGSASVKFYNGDRYTKIRCILEGITDEGIPIFADHTYKIALARE